MTKTVLKRNLYDAEYHTKNNIIAIFIFAISLIALITGFLQTAFVRGNSMNPTLYDGQHLILLKKGFNIGRGDIVVANHSELGSIIKRVIACPGDTVEIQDNEVYVNGIQLQEPYIAEPICDSDFSAVTLSDEQYFLMGDNRNRSADSRKYGCVSSNEIEGVIYLERQTQLSISKLIIIFSLIIAVCIYLERTDAN